MLSGENEEEERIHGNTSTFKTTEKLAKPVTNSRALNQRTCALRGL
jgi:hypothetical protein